MRASWLIATIAVVLVPPASVRSDQPSDDDMTFECSADGIGILHLIDVAAEVTGEVFFYEPREVSGTGVFFPGKLDVPRARFLSFFDWYLFSSGLVDVQRTVGEKCVHAISRLGPQGRHQSAFKTDAPTVPPEDISELSDRYMLVTTWVHCTSNDLAREIACPILCQFFSDSGLESIRNIEGSGAILMTGQAANVVKYAAMAKQIDAAHASDFNSKLTQDIDARIAALEQEVATIRKRSAEASDK